MGARISFLVALGAISLLSCESDETKECHRVMTAAQEVVNGVDSKDLSSVERSLAAVEGAIAACTKAGRAGEVDALTRAQNELSGQADYLRKRAAEPKREKRSPEELAAIEKSGDPSCPRGQAYKPDPAGKEIRCTGPQLVDMSYEEAEHYFQNRGYKITTTDTPPTLKAEYGAELNVFTYAAPRDDHPARCLTLYPAPGIPYQEATARATGAPMRKIEKDGTVHTRHGDVAIHVDESETKLIIRLGDCG